MKISRKFLKRIPFIRLIANLHRALNFLKRATLLRAKLLKLDRASPFQGRLSKSGYTSFEMSPITLTYLKSLLKKNEVTLNDTYKSVFLFDEFEPALTEIFGLVSEEVRSYLGPDAYLDGINWMVSSPKQESISSNWHTDNVGNRLKLFICVNGDGSQPTLIVPSNDRIPNFVDWLKHTAIEFFRWFGKTKDNHIQGQVSLAHIDGSAFLFDTQLLHRGEYKKGAASRIIFHMEFSNPRKHKISRGPIGSKSFNSFNFSANLLKVTAFQKMLDPRRLKTHGGICYYGVEQK